MAVRPAARPAPTVLVVDDDPDLRTVLRLLLEDDGYQARLACHGQDALTELQREAVAVLLLDLNMPGMTGWECLAALRAAQHLVPVVLMTAAQAAASEAARLGVAGYVAKPFDLDAVVQTVQAQLAAAVSRHAGAAPAPRTDRRA